MLAPSLGFENFRFVNLLFESTDYRQISKRNSNYRSKYYEWIAAGAKPGSNSCLCEVYFQKLDFFERAIQLAQWLENGEIIFVLEEQFKGKPFYYCEDRRKNARHCPVHGLYFF